MATTLGIALLTVALSTPPISDPVFEKCVADAQLVRRPDAARIMCAKTFEVVQLRAALDAVPTCPDCPPPTVEVQNDWSELLGATAIGVIIGALAVSAVWVGTSL